MCKSLASLCCGYPGAAPVHYVQDANLNLPNPYLRSTTVLLDTCTSSLTIDLCHVSVALCTHLRQ